MSVTDEKTNQYVLKLLEDQGRLFRTFKYQNTLYREKSTGERVLMLTKDSWFFRVTDRLKMRCLQELAHVKYVPALNLKTTEETHQDLERLKAKRGAPGEDVDAYYFNIVEEVNEFNDWCISEESSWGIPIPYFTYRDSGEVLMDAEIARYVATLFRREGGSDAWFRLPVEELLPPRYKSEARKLEKGSQVFDVWFDNALTWGYVLG